MVEEKEKVLEPIVEAIIEKNLKHIEKTGVTTGECSEVLLMARVSIKVCASSVTVL